MYSSSRLCLCSGAAERARRHRMLDQGEAAVGLLAVDHETDADAPQEASLTVLRSNNLRLCRLHLLLLFVRQWSREYRSDGLDELLVQLRVGVADDRLRPAVRPAAALGSNRTPQYPRKRGSAARTSQISSAERLARSDLAAVLGEHSDARRTTCPWSARRPTRGSTGRQQRSAPRRMQPRAIDDGAGLSGPRMRRR